MKFNAFMQILLRAGGYPFRLEIFNFSIKLEMVMFKLEIVGGQIEGLRLGHKIRAQLFLPAVRLDS